MNIRIPILLGEVVNIITSFLSKDDPINFAILNPVATNLMILYAGQVF